MKMKLLWLFFVQYLSNLSMIRTLDSEKTSNDSFLFFSFFFFFFVFFTGVLITMCSVRHHFFSFSIYHWTSFFLSVCVLLDFNDGSKETLSIIINKVDQNNWTTPLFSLPQSIDRSEDDANPENVCSSILRRIPLFSSSSSFYARSFATPSSQSKNKSISWLSSPLDSPLLIDVTLDCIDVFINIIIRTFYALFTSNMESHRRHRRFYSSPSIQMHYDPSSAEEDALSLQNLNEEVMVGMDFLTSKYQSLLQKHFYQAVTHYQDVNRTGWFINGAFFDEQIFQSAPSPQDANRYLQGHQAKSTPSASLNAHLFKLAFVLTLSDCSIEKDAILDFYPQEDHIFQDIRNYKHFCFPELNVGQASELVHETSTYIFTRTLSDGQMEYGYCRRLTKDHQSWITNPIVICLGNGRSVFLEWSSMWTFVSL